MYKDLLSYVKKPRLWQRSNEPFWNDEHISKGMLEMHLNPDLELASRKAETIVQSVDWLSTVIQSGAKILDLGCGPGLYTKKLSALGYDVTGVDFSSRSLAYAQSEDTKTKYIFQNYLEIDFENNFDAIIIIYCDFAALTKDERELLLKKIYKALKPNGVFIFDVFTSLSFKSEPNPPTWTLFEEGGYWNPNSHICLEAVHLYEDNTISLNQYVVITEESAKEYLIWNTMYTLESLSQELSQSSFQILEKFDDVCGKTYSEKSETLCVIATKNEV